MIFSTLSKSLSEVNWAVAYDDAGADKVQKYASGGQPVGDRKVAMDVAVEAGEEKFRIYAYRGKMPKEEGGFGGGVL